MSEDIKIESKRKLNKKLLLGVAALAAVAVVAAATVFVPKAADAKRVEEQLNLGEKYLDELDYEQAIAAYQTVIEIDPKNEEAYLALAEIYIELGEYDKAEEILDEARDNIDSSDIRDMQKEVKKQQKEAELNPSPTPIEIPTPTVTNTPAPTETPTPVPTNTPVPTGTPTPMPTETPTPAPTETPTPVPTETPTPTPTNTPVPTETPTPRPTNTPTPTPRPTNTPTPTPRPTNTPTPRPTNTPTPTPKPTNTPTPSPSPTPFVSRVEGTKVGDIITLGAYEQDGNTSNGKEPIEWVVLELKNGSALLVSKKILEMKQYHTSDIDITWAKSSLRKWMNDTFYYNAFTSKEREKIIRTSNYNMGNFEFPNTYGGDVTNDYVFLLSSNDILTYYPQEEDRTAECSDYALDQGVDVINGAGRYWLRGPGMIQQMVQVVGSEGDINNGDLAYLDYIGVRPCVWIALENSASTTISDINESWVETDLTFMQKVYTNMKNENYEYMHELDGSDEADSFVYKMDGTYFVYFPENNKNFTGTGAGMYRTENAYYFYYGSYVNGQRSGYGVSFHNNEGEGYYVFSGMWENDRPNGTGQMLEVRGSFRGGGSYKSYTYGNVVNGIWDGRMERTINNGSTEYEMMPYVLDMGKMVETMTEEFFALSGETRETVDIYDGEEILTYSYSSWNGWVVSFSTWDYVYGVIGYGDGW